MTKIDFKKDLKHLYNPPAKAVVIVDVPQMNFLMVDGAGNPNTSHEFKDAIEALYAVSYALKFIIKKEMTMDYVVMPPEGLWWCDDMAEFNTENKDAWKWILMIMQPQYVTEDLFDKAIIQVEIKKKLPAISRIRFQNLHEGLSAQIMHIGPYSDEAPTIEKLHDFIKENGYGFSGKHHEIYLSDPRKSSPQKMKTVLRQPIKKMDQV